MAKSKSPELTPEVHYVTGPQRGSDGPFTEDGTRAVAPWRGTAGGYEETKPFVYLGTHVYGFSFFLVLENDKTKTARVHCGCRSLTYDQAMKHWAGGVSAKSKCPRPHHRALVKCAREIAKINGWKF